MPTENTSPEAVLESVTSRLATLEGSMADWKALIEAARTKAEQTQDSALSMTVDELEERVAAELMTQGLKLLLDPELFSLFVASSVSSDSRT